jgi:predicted nucleotidyltransferase
VRAYDLCVKPGVPAEIGTALQESAARLRERFGTRLRDVVLFGSYAWGDADADSDVDVCVVIEGLTSQERSAAMDMVAEVGIERDVLLAPLVWSAAGLEARLAHELALAEDIERRGVRL